MTGPTRASGRNTKKKLQKFFDLLTEYRKARNELSKYAESTLLDVVKNKKVPEEVLLGGIESEKGYAEFIAEAYGIGVDRKDFLKKLNTPKEAKSPQKFKEELYKEINIKKFENAFPSAINVIYDDLINAGFKSAAKFRGDYKGVAEDLLKMFIELSPLYNPQTFFINSLKHTPKFYVKMMYGDTEFIENYFKWKKWTTWRDLEDEYNLWSYDESGEWYYISEALDKMYGPINDIVNCADCEDFEDPGLEISNLIEKYSGIENPTRRYFKIYKKKLRYPEIWKEVHLEGGCYTITTNGKPTIERLVYMYRKRSGSYGYFLDTFDVNVEDKLFIKCIAPQMFLGLTKIYEGCGRYNIILGSCK